MSYRSPRFIPQDTGQAWSTVTTAGVDAAATIAKKKADHAESERLRGEELAKAGNLEQQYRDAFVNSMFLTSTKMNNQIKGQEGYRADNKTVEKRKEAIKNMQQFGWLYKG